MGRQRGWTKLHSSREGAYGAINIQWDTAARVLICRVVTRGEYPALITGDFVAYLVSRHRRRIQTINVFP